MLVSARLKIALAGLAVVLAATALAASAYERQLSSRSLREAFFLGKDTTFRSEEFFKDYAQTFPLPEEGVYVKSIEVATPFKAMVDRARQASDGYNPVQAEADYRRQTPPVSVKVTLQLTPSYPAHSPFSVPFHVGPIYLRSPDFWQEFKVRLEQGAEVTPLAVRGRPSYSCPREGPCWVTGAVVTLDYNPEQVASRPARIVVLTPDGQRVEAEFDLDRLR